MDIGAVVVAAGMSSRMDDFKPMMDIGEISIAQRVIATLRRGGAEEIVIITGYNADKLERHLAKSDVIFLRNEVYRTTQMFDSAKIGLSYMMNKCERILFTPVDIPLFTAATVRTLLLSSADCVYPVYAGKRGHPLLLVSALVPSLLADSGDAGLQGAISRSGALEEGTEVSDPGILHDADTQEDYQILLEMYNNQLIRLGHIANFPGKDLSLIGVLPSRPRL